MSALQQLSQKIQQLLRAYGALQTENASLRQQVAQLREQHDLLLKKNQTLEEAHATEMLGAQALPEAEKQKLRRYIDSVVDEIDKILTSLHE